MKRFLSFFIFVFSLSQLSAQLFTHVGGAVGFGQSKILGEKTEFEKVKDIQNFSVGLVGEHRFDSPFLITTGVRLIGFGDSTIYTNSVVSISTTVTSINRYKNMRYYMQVPLCFGLNISLGEDNSNLILKGGAYYGSLIGSRTSGKQSIITATIVTDTIIDSKGFFPYPKKEFGWIAALGYGTDQYSIEIQFNKGLTSLFNQPGDLPKYNYAYMVTLTGYLPN
jgi:hypothetical protein